MLIGLDPRGKFQQQGPEPEGDVMEIQVRDKATQVVKVGKTLPPPLLRT
jgi:hypothetical protein